MNVTHANYSYKIKLKLIEKIRKNSRMTSTEQSYYKYDFKNKRSGKISYKKILTSCFLYLFNWDFILILFLFSKTKIVFKK